jgi:hypothetical protein
MPSGQCDRFSATSRTQLGLNPYLQTVHKTIGEMKMRVKEQCLPEDWEVTYCEYGDAFHDPAGKGLFVQHFLGEQEDYGRQIAEFNKVVIKGPAVFVADDNSLYESDELQDFESEFFVDPTWLDIIKVFRQQVETTSDSSKATLHGFRPIYYSDLKNVQSVIRNGRDDVPIYELIVWHQFQH